MIKPILFLTFLVFSPALVQSKSSKFPPFLTKCAIKQADFDDCVIKATKNGIEQLEKVTNYLNLTPINPFTLPEARFDAQGVLAVEQIYRNVEVYGLVDCKMDTFRFDFEKNTINISGLLPKLTILSDYKFSGKILLLTVEGSGRGNVTIENLQVTSFAKFEKTEKNNRHYIKLVSNKLKMIPEQVYLHFEHIFRENEEISNNINHVMNENWREVYADVEEGYTEVVSTILVNLLNQFFSKLSFEEVFN